MSQFQRLDIPPSASGDLGALSRNQAIVYGALCAAAREGLACPNYLDLNELIGAESSSTSPTIVKRLEQRGLIVVVRFQRFRRVMICATGEWTMKAPSQKTTSLHVPRGRGTGPRRQRWSDDVGDSNPV